MFTRLGNYWEEELANFTPILLLHFNSEKKDLEEYNDSVVVLIDTTSLTVASTYSSQVYCSLVPRLSLLRRDEPGNEARSTATLHTEASGWGLSVIRGNNSVDIWPPGKFKGRGIEAGGERYTWSWRWICFPNSLAGQTLTCAERVWSNSYLVSSPDPILLRRGLWGLVVVRLSWLSGRALATQARSVLGSTPGGCWPFSLFSPHYIQIQFSCN